MADLPLTYLFDPTRVVDRAKAYASCIGGRRYSVVDQTPSNTVAGQTSFSATTPTFLISQSNANGRRVILSNFALCQDGTPAGGTIHLLLAIDPGNRYSSGGTAITPQATMAESEFSAGFSFRTNPTVSAPSAVRYLSHWTQPVWAGAVFNPDLQDGVAIGETGSILLYTWAAGTAPTWVLGGFDILEES